MDPESVGIEMPSHYLYDGDITDPTDLAAFLGFMQEVSEAYEAGIKCILNLSLVCRNRSHKEVVLRLLQEFGEGLEIVIHSSMVGYSVELIFDLLLKAGPTVVLLPTAKLILELNSSMVNTAFLDSPGTRNMILDEHKENKRIVDRFKYLGITEHGAELLTKHRYLHLSLETAQAMMDTLAESRPV